MQYRKFNKYEKKEIRKEVLQNALAGGGMYLYENNTDADITLPRPTSSGLRVIGGRKQFQGDDYYIQLVRTGLLKLIEVIQTKEQQEQALQEAAMAEENEKLILDQPDIITEAGKIEHVAGDPVLGQPAPQQFNEDGTPVQPTPQPDVLINETPVAGGFVIVDE